MDLTKFTERARGFVQSAQSIAVREDHQRLEPLHLLKALMDDREGFAANLITRSGGDAAQLSAQIEQAFAKLPKVSGGSSQMILDTSNQHCKSAKRSGKAC
jgi:ATP-dependent Clp protease ATP-binding subunit ClpB